MKITPLEIRQKDFEKKLRGYDKDEVQAFLYSLSGEWEHMIDENKEYKIKLELAEKEVRKLREVESSLFKTLKTAEDTGANLVDQANKAAELHMKETQMKADALLQESKQKAKAVIEQSEEEAKEIINEVQEGVKELDQNYQAIASQRDTLIKELLRLASDLAERVEKMDKKKGNFKIEDQIKRIRDLARASERKIDSEHLEFKAKPIDPISVEKIQKNVANQQASEVAAMDKKYGVRVRKPEQQTADPTKRKEMKDQRPIQKKTIPPSQSSDTPRSRKSGNSKNSFFDLIDE